MPKVFIQPGFNKEGGEGGIKRVVEAQRKWLPSYGWDICEEIEHADLVAVHATVWPNSPLMNQLPVVSHCHGLYWQEYEWDKWALEANRLVVDSMLKADAVTAPTEWVAQVIRRGSWLPVDVIGHGVDIDEWSTEGNGAGSYILWNKTRPDPICDPRPVTELARMCPDLQFVSTFGEGANVQKIVVSGHGEHKDVIRGASLYLCTARETYGIGTLEALACGVPVVGWNFGGQSEFITSSMGYLAPVGDFEALRAGIYYCLNNRDRLSNNARAFAESRSWPSIMEQYAQLYDRVLAAKGIEKRVSVIVPSYNLSSYLGECIDSVAQQLGPKDEIIVVDDCSTDGSYEIALQKLGLNLQARVLKTPANLYLAGALNYGIDQAKGRYILPLDADNYLEKGVLDTLANELDKDRGLDIAYGKVKFVNENGEPNQQVAPDGISSWPKSFDYAAQMEHKNQLPSTSMYRKKVWSRIGGYRSRYKTAEDADFWCRATSYGGRARMVTQAVTFVYRDRSDSMSRINIEPAWDAWYKWEQPPFAAPGWSEKVRSNKPEQPTISVIVPVGPGHEVVVRDALDSLMIQSFTDWECIVVDDSHAIRWLPSWAKVIKTDHSGSGVSIARNLGVANSRGAYFLLLDADDYIEKDALELMYEAILEGGYGTYVYSDYFRAEEVEPRRIADFNFNDMINMLHHPITCLFPRDLERVDGVRFDESLVCGEDWDYLIAAIKAGYCGIRVPKPLLYYRRNSGSNRKTLENNFNEVKQLLHGKWGTELACSSCSSGRVSTRGGGPPRVQPPAGGQNGQVVTEELVQIEYLGDEAAARTYRGQVTGKNYRFGNSDFHRIKYVDGRDASWFLNRLEFRRVGDPATVGV